MMNKQLLLIEDNADVRENTAEILELANYDVLTAENGKIGVELAQEKLPDLIICDIMMPVLDGYGVLHILNKKPETASIPFIFLTAKAERSDYRKGMNLGADDYLTKPFDDSELLDAVEGRLRRNESIAQQIEKNSISSLDNLYKNAKELEDLTALSSDRKIREFKKKSTIYWEGDYANSLIFIVSGKVKTFKTHKDGKQFITGMHSAGDFIGHKGLLSSSGYTESAETIEKSEICKIPKQDFFDFIYSSKDIANKFIKMITNNLKDQEESLLHLAYDSVRQRVAGALLNLSEQFDQKTLAIPRDDLARLVGTAQESVIRTLSDFRQESIIEIKTGKITIVDIEKMKSVSIRGY